MSFVQNTAKDAFSITAGAGALARPANALYIGVAGDITLTTRGGTSIQFTGLQSGQILPVECTHVTASTAAGIIGLLDRPNRPWIAGGSA